MSEQTPNLSLPFILPSQAQKHVSHNEALQRLDALVQLVIDSVRTAPPEAPDEGRIHAVAKPATGSWQGQDGKLALFQDGAWVFVAPRPGWRAFLMTSGALCVFAEGLWRPVSLGRDGRVEALGVNAAPQPGQRLIVSSDASLFTDEGRGHRLTINKSKTSETASLIFQSAWSGRAEIGLAGEDRLAFKVSADGGTWRTALAVDPSGAVLTPGRPAVCAGLAGQGPSPANGARLGFSAPSLAQGGFALGASLQGGGASLLVPLGGFYLLGLSAMTQRSGGYGLSLQVNETRTIASLTGPAASGPERHTATGLVRLEAGDRLSLLHSGSADYRPGFELSEAWFTLI